MQHWNNIGTNFHVCCVGIWCYKWKVHSVNIMVTRRVSAWNMRRGKTLLLQLTMVENTLPASWCSFPSLIMVIIMAAWQLGIEKHRFSRKSTEKISVHHNGDDQFRCRLASHKCSIGSTAQFGPTSVDVAQHPLCCAVLCWLWPRKPILWIQLRDSEIEIGCCCSIFTCILSVSETTFNTSSSKLEIRKWRNLIILTLSLLIKTNHF